MCEDCKNKLLDFIDDEIFNIKTSNCFLTDDQSRNSLLKNTAYIESLIYFKKKVNEKLL